MVACIGLLLLFSAQVHAAEEPGYKSIGSQVWIAVPEQSVSSIGVIDHHSEWFRPSFQGFPNLGYRSDPVWIRIDPGTLTPGNMLVLENPNIDNATLYQRLVSGQWQSLSLGTYHAFRERPIKLRSLVFPVQQGLDQSYPLYLKVETETAIMLPLFVATYEGLLVVASNDDTWSGLFLGIMLALAFYHMIIYFVVGHVSYLYFSLSVIFYTLFLASIEGFLQQRIFYADSSGIVNKSLLVGFSLSTLFFISFLQSVIKTKSFAPNWHKALLVLQVVFVIWVPVCVWVDYKYMGPYSVYLSVLSTVVCSLATLRIALTGYRPARLFMLMWVAFVLAAALRTAQLLGISPFLMSGSWLLKTGSVIGVLFLASALAQRIKMIKDAETSALNYAVKVQHSAKQELEQRVAMRTKDLLIEKEYLEYVSQARNAFYTHVNHEIRTPTTAILQYLSFLKRGVGCAPLDDKQSQYLAVVEQNAYRIRNLTDQMLDLEKNNMLEAQGYLEKTSVSEVLKKCLSRMDGLFSEKVEIQVALDHQLDWVKANSSYLESVLENLLSNAAKYTRQGSVKIVSEPGENAGHEPLVKVWVIDTGIGVNPQDRQLIFQPFEGDQAQERSTGIGLATCKTLVSRMGGQIGVEPNKNGGSAFWFTLRGWA